MSIVFGSPEAQAILAKDKEAQRLEQERLKQEAYEASPEYIEDRINDLDGELEYHEMEVARLIYQRSELHLKLREMRKGILPPTSTASLTRWNAQPRRKPQPTSREPARRHHERHNTT